MRISLHGFSHPGFVIPVFIQIIANVLFLYLPVLKYFSYESAVINCVSLSFVLGYFYRSSENEEKNSALNLILGTFIIWVIAPLIYFAAEFLKEECSFFHGLKFYLTGTIPIVFISYFLNQIIGLLFIKFRFLLYSVVVFVISIEPLFEFYFLEQIVFYNPIIFYYPGTIYDELIQIDFRLISHRLLSDLFFAGVYLFVRKFVKNRIFIYMGIVGTVILYYVSIAPAFTYITNTDRLIRNNYTISKTLHFEIIHPANLNKQRVEALLHFHEFQLTELNTILKLKNDFKIRSFVYKDSDAKEEFFGSSNADVAKPWRKEIHTTLSSVFGNLRHELAHIVAGEFANPPFYVASYLNPNLIEGFATAMSFSFDDAEIPALLNGAEKIHPVKAEDILNLSSFFRSNSRLAYLRSGAFIQYLLQRYGAEKIKLLYKTGDFKGIFEESVDKVYAAFVGQRNSIVLERDSVSAAYYFSVRPYILKKCPRLLAEKFNDAVAAFNSKDWPQVDILTQDLLKLSDENRILRLRLEFLTQKKQYNKVIRLIESRKSTSGDINLKLKLLDTKVQRGDSVSTADYSRLSASSPHFRFDAVLKTRQLLVNKNILDEYLDGEDSVRKELLLNNLSNENSFLLLPLSTMLKKDEIFEALELISSFNIYTEYTKLLVIRSMIDEGNWQSFEEWIQKIKQEHLPTGSIFDMEIYKRFSSYMKNQNQLMRE